MLQRTSFFLVVSLFLVGCGYTFKGSGSSLPPDVKQINIPLAENNTPEPGLSLIVTQALRDRFERYGVLVVVDSSRDADAILRARILRVNRETQTVTSNTDTALQERTVIVLSAELRRTTGPLLWSNPNMQVSKAFGTTSDVVVTSSSDFAQGNLSAADLGALGDREVSRGQEREALQDLSEEAARRIYDEAVTPEF